MAITLDGTNGITTPDITSSGALGVNASAPDNSLVVDSSGNVGVGTSSPTAKLDVAGSVYSSGIFRATVDGTAAVPSIQPGPDNDTGIYRPATNVIGFSTLGTERMRIDSAGRVTMPYQPAFSASSTGTQSLSTTGDHQINSSYGGLSTVLLNVGNHFDSSTGRFTAPITGRYVLQASLACAYTSGYCYFYIKKNGASYGGGYRNFGQSGDYTEQSINNILTLNAGDYVEMQVTNNFTGGAIYSPMFSGYLVS